MRLLVTVLFFCLPLYCQAGEETYVEKLLVRYSQLDSYCDSGHIRTVRGDIEKFERCFRSDGHYINEIYLNNSWKNRKIRWSDGVTEYLFSGYIKGGREKTSSLWDRPFHTKMEIADYVIPAEIINHFGIETRTGYQNRIYSNLNEFKKNEVLSNNEFTVLERHRSFNNGTSTDMDRKWISNRDFIITKAEYFRDGEPKNSVEVIDYRLDPSLTLDDLTYDPPFVTKYSPFRHLNVSIPVLFITALLVGLFTWIRRFSLGKSIRDNTIWWPDKFKMWKPYFTFVAIAFTVFFVLGLLSLPAGGHPPAIMFIWGIGFYFGLVVAAVGFFMLGAYPAYWISRLRLSRKIEKLGNK